jgi:hypothetical protein
MKKIRNTTVYRAQFSGLKLSAFGIEQTLPWVVYIEIYQARVSPELWRGRPHFRRLGHAWEAASAESLMQLIASDFEERHMDWLVFPEEPPALTERDRMKLRVLDRRQRA